MIPFNRLIMSSSSTTLKVSLRSAAATPPKRCSALAAGYDVYASSDGVVPARSKAVIPTGVAVAVPDGTYGRIAPRSGLAAKHSIDVGAGVIDADYRGEVHVLLFNHSDVDFSVSKGDRIAQLILERIETPPVELVGGLDETARGDGKFGSTGTN